MLVWIIFFISEWYFVFWWLIMSCTFLGALVRIILFISELYYINIINNNITLILNYFWMIFCDLVIDNKLEICVCISKNNILYFGRIFYVLMIDNRLELFSCVLVRIIFFVLEIYSIIGLVMHQWPPDNSELFLNDILWMINNKFEICGLLLNFSRCISNVQITLTYFAMIFYD